MRAFLPITSFIRFRPLGPTKGCHRATHRLLHFTLIWNIFQAIFKNLITLKHFTLDGAENCSSSCALSAAYATYLKRLQSYLAGLSLLKVDNVSERSNGELP